MAGANYMGGKRNAARARLKDYAGRIQKGYFGKRRLDTAFTKGLGNLRADQVGGGPADIGLAHARMALSSSLPSQEQAGPVERSYIEPPSTPRHSTAFDDCSSNSNSLGNKLLPPKILTALDLSEPISFKAKKAQLLAISDFAGLHAWNQEPKPTISQIIREKDHMKRKKSSSPLSAPTKKTNPSYHQKTLPRMPNKSNMNMARSGVGTFSSTSLNSPTQQKEPIPSSPSPITATTSILHICDEKQALPDAKDHYSHTNVFEDSGFSEFSASGGLLSGVSPTSQRSDPSAASWDSSFTALRPDQTPHSRYMRSSLDHVLDSLGSPCRIVSSRHCSSSSTSVSHQRALSSSTLPYSDELILSSPADSAEHQSPSRQIVRAPPSFSSRSQRSGLLSSLSGFSNNGLHSPASILSSSPVPLLSPAFSAFDEHHYSVSNDPFDSESISGSDAWRAVGELLQLSVPSSPTLLGSSRVTMMQELKETSTRYGVGFHPGDNLQPDNSRSAISHYSGPQIQPFRGLVNAQVEDEEMLDYDTPQSTQPDGPESRLILCARNEDVSADQQGLKVRGRIPTTVDELLMQGAMDPSDSQGEDLDHAAEQNSSHSRKDIVCKDHAKSPIHEDEGSGTSAGTGERPDKPSVPTTQWSAKAPIDGLPGNLHCGAPRISSDSERDFNGDVFDGPCLFGDKGDEDEE